MNSGLRAPQGPEPRGPKPIKWPPVWIVGLLLLTAIGAAYSNSLHGPFVFDDFESIPGNVSIRHLWDLGTVLNPPGNGVTVDSRPILNLSFALDYALAGLSVGAYHATNLFIHILAALTLFGIVRRAALLTRGATPPFALGFGACAALLWGLHPLQTESVTYVVQRAESLMGLFYLATLYGFLRMSARGSGRDSGPWAAFSLGCCLLGMATKEVMVSAPLVVLLLDRTFVSGTFKAALARRRAYYAALAATWILLAALVLQSGGRGYTSGPRSGVPVLKYWLTQGPAITRYLRLALWPHPLLLDYGFENHWLEHPAAALLHLACVLAIGGATLAALRRPSLAGLLGFWAFSILAPTSLVPGNRQTVAEHRMYLALAPVIVGLLAAAVAVLRPSPHAPLSRRTARLCVATVLLLAAASGIATFRRNKDYATELGLMRDTCAKNPDSAATHFDLGYVLLKRGESDEGLRELHASLAINPNYIPVLMNLGDALVHEGRPEEGLPYIQRGEQLRPDSSTAASDYAAALVALGRPSEALPWCRRAVSLDTHSALALGALGANLATLGRIPEAMDRFADALRIDPDYEPAHLNLGRLLLGRSNLPAALEHLRAAVRLDPSDYQARYYLGTALVASGSLQDAVAEFQVSLTLEPRSAAAHSNLATALANLGRLPEAVVHLEEAVHLNPGSAELHDNLAAAYAASNRPADALRQSREALEIDPADATAQAALNAASAPSP